MCLSPWQPRSSTCKLYSPLFKAWLGSVAVAVAGTNSSLYSHIVSVLQSCLHSRQGLIEANREGLNWTQAWAVLACTWLESPGDLTSSPLPLHLISSSLLLACLWSVTINWNMKIEGPWTSDRIEFWTRSALMRGTLASSSSSCRLANYNFFTSTLAYNPCSIKQDCVLSFSSDLGLHRVVLSWIST